MKDKLIVDKVAQAIFEVVQDTCYCNAIGVVDGIMSGEDWNRCAEAAIKAMETKSEG